MEVVSEDFYEGVSPPQVVKDTVNIQIGDVNDNAPIFHGQPYTVHIPEVRLMGSLLVICKGMQVGLHQQITWVHDFASEYTHTYNI